MIKTKEELKKCLKIEKKIYYPNGGIVLPFGIREKDILYRFIYNLRKTEYHCNLNHKYRYSYYKLRLRKMQNQYALHIPVNTCGVGLSIAHVGPIIINGKCRIGNNLRIHVGVNIGANGGNPPTIGNNVYIAPGAKLFGDITIVDNCRIGANAVVNKSCNIIGATLVGIPAQMISSDRNKKSLEKYGE